MLRRRIRIVLGVLLALFALLFVFLLFERIRGQVSLARYKRELVAQGEKLTFRELIPPVPEGENGAPQILEATERLQKGSVLPNNPPPMMKLVASGRAVVGFRENEWVDYDNVTNHWDALAADLKANEVPLAQIRAALAKPVLNNQLDYSQGLQMTCPHIGPTLSLTKWLEAETQFALHEGRLPEALDSLVAQIHLLRLLGEDRILISELVRRAIAAIARAATWEALQADGWTDGDLARIQQAWQAEDFMAGMARSLEVRRAFGETAFAHFSRSNEDAAYALFLADFLSRLSRDDGAYPPNSWRATYMKQIYCWVWRLAWLHQDQRRYLEHMQRLLEATRAAAVKKSRADVQSVVAWLSEKSSNKNFYDELRYPDPESVVIVSRGVKHAMRAETERSLTMCAVALKRYQLRYGKPPASLDALVPEFLSSVPVDYMDGKPMKYHLNADGSFVLYSVGADGHDDGGDPSLPPDMYSYRSIWDGRDAVWPWPALPDEIEAYHKEARKN